MKHEHLLLVNDSVKFCQRFPTKKPARLFRSLTNDHYFNMLLLQVRLDAWQDQPRERGEQGRRQERRHLLQQVRDKQVGAHRGEEKV